MAEFSSLNGYTVKDAIARNIAKGRNQAVAYSDYATMIEALNAMDNEEFKTGQNIYIGTVGVPDLWVYSIEPIQHNFAYVSDEEAVEMLKNNTTIQMKIKEDFRDEENHIYRYICELYAKKGDENPSVTAKISVMETEDVHALFGD